MAGNHTGEVSVIAFYTDWKSYWLQAEDKDWQCHELTIRSTEMVQKLDVIV
jgi:hypothetical protein